MSQFLFGWPLWLCWGFRAHPSTWLKLITQSISECSSDYTVWTQNCFCKWGLHSIHAKGVLHISWILGHAENPWIVIPLWYPLFSCRWIQLHTVWELLTPTMLSLIHCTWCSTLIKQHAVLESFRRMQQLQKQWEGSPAWQAIPDTNGMFQT